MISGLQALSPFFVFATIVQNVFPWKVPTILKPLKETRISLCESKPNVYSFPSDPETSAKGYML